MSKNKLQIAQQIDAITANYKCGKFITNFTDSYRNYSVEHLQECLETWQEHAAKLEDRPLEEIIDEWGNWSVETFAKSDARSCVAHLFTEVKEFKDEIVFGNKEKQIAEGVDCLLSTLSGLTRCGATAADIKAAIIKKFNINKGRKWKINPDNTYSHVKESA